jgi:hypothetical protein
LDGKLQWSEEETDTTRLFLQALNLVEDEELPPKITKKINLLLMELNETSAITP